jgi:hypothetical protein
MQALVYQGLFYYQNPLQQILSQQYKTTETGN